MTRLFLILMMLAFGQSASAGSVTLTFNEFACNGTPATSGRNGSVSYTNPNNGFIGVCGPQIVLGDDGLSQQMKIFADPGARFDLVSFDVQASYEVFKIARSLFNEGRDTEVEERGGNLIEESFFWDVGPNGELSEAARPELAETHPFLAITGLRDGEIIARTRIDTNGRSNYQPGSEFSDLDEIRLAVTANSRDIWSSRRYLFGCGNQCGQATIDNVVLNVQVAAVPLPATAMLMGLGLLALWPLRRMRKRGSV